MTGSNRLPITDASRSFHARHEVEDGWQYTLDGMQMHKEKEKQDAQQVDIKHTAALRTLIQPAQIA